MRLLVLPTIDIPHHADQLVDGDVMHVPLQMQLQIFAFETEELPAINDNTNLLGKPARSRPQLLGIRRVDGSIDHQHVRYAQNRLSCRQLLIAPAYVTPATSLRLPSDTCFEDLGE